MYQQPRTSIIPGISLLLIAITLATTNGFAQDPVHVLKTDDRVTRIAVSSDSKLVAAGCSTHTEETGSIFIWDMKTGKQIQKLKGYPFSLAGLEFIHDGKYVILAGLASTVRICEVSTGEVVSKIENLDRLAGLVSIGHAGLFGLSEARGFYLWDVSNPAFPKQTKHFPKFGEGALGIFSIDCKLWVEALNSADLNELPPTAPCKIAVWDVASGKVLERFNGQQNNVRRMALSSNKNILAISYLFGPPNNIEVRTLKGGKLVFSASNPGLPASIAFSPSGDYLAVGSATTGTLMIWNVSKNAPPKKIDAHSGTVQCLEFTSDGKYLVSGSADHTVKLWRFDNLK